MILATVSAVALAREWPGFGDGQAPTAGQIDSALQDATRHAPGGSPAAPGIAFQAAPGSGFYLDPAGFVGAVRDGAVTVDLGVTRDLIENFGNPHLAQTYFGRRYYDQPPGVRINNRLHVWGRTAGWEENETVATIIANAPHDTPSGGMGTFYDFNDRRGYGFQDYGALGVGINTLMPIADDVPVASFTRLRAINFAGQPQTVYKVNLRTPLTAAQVAQVREQMRVATNNNFFGYIVPPGMKDAEGNPVHGVAPDGSYVIVDNWTRGAPLDPEGPDVLPSGYGMSGHDKPLARYTIALNVGNTAGAIGMGILFQEGDHITGGEVTEGLVINNKTTPTVWNDAQPAGDVPVLEGQHVVCQTSAQAWGTCSTGFRVYDGNANFRRGFVADNEPLPAPANQLTYGFVVPYPGPSIGFWSAQGPDRNGHPAIVAEVQPRGTQPATFLLDSAGNVVHSGVESAAAFGPSAPSGIVAARGTWQFTSPLEVGSIALTPLTVATLPAHCKPGMIAYAGDGREPGEPAGAGSGVQVFCNGKHAWIAAATGAAVRN